MSVTGELALLGRGAVKTQWVNYPITYRTYMLYQVGVIADFDKRLENNGTSPSHAHGTVSILKIHHESKNFSNHIT